MPTLSVQQALKNFTENKIESLYLLIGDENYFSDRCLSSLRNLVVSDDLRDFNEDIFYGAELKIESLLDALQAMPVMAERRLVILKDAQAISEKDWLQLDELKNLIHGSLVFVIQANQLDKRKKSIKKWIEVGNVIECLTPQEVARAPWIKTLASEKGLELENEALAYLVQMGGNTLSELDCDMDKLRLFFGEAKRLSIGEVAQVLQRSREESIFSLADAIGKKDRPQALFLFHRLHEQGESEIALVSLIARHLRILLKIKRAQQLGMKGPLLAQKVGVNNYFVQGYTQQANFWSEADLSQSLVSLARMDRELKSSSLASDLWLEQFLLFG